MRIAGVSFNHGIFCFILGAALILTGEVEDLEVRANRHFVLKGNQASQAIRCICRHFCTPYGQGKVDCILAVHVRDI